MIFLFLFLFQVVFVPDYNVSVAEVLIPGSELSQHVRYFGRIREFYFLEFFHSSLNKEKYGKKGDKMNATEVLELQS